MAQLAIKEHPTRGKEVIEILEMLGGKNLNNLDGASNMYYLIGLIVPKILGASKLELDKSNEQFTYFTLEEFEKKFPYKIGDKVCYQPNLQIDTICISEIISMKWADNSVIYFTSNGHSLYACDLQPFKEETIEEEKENFAECIEKTIQECLFGKEGATKEIKIDIPEGYEFFGIDDNNKVVLTKIQPQYPKTYEGCCKALMGKTDFQDFELVLTRYTITRSEENSISLCPPHISLINNFYKLFICRDAYWKIAGEQMGLGKPWEPDFTNNDEERYGIYTLANKVERDFCGVGDVNMVLSFPTEEMRDAFYDNFKELIEECKDLL